MREAKERKRLERDYTPRIDRPNLCMQVVVKNYECAEPTSITYHLQACPARRDSYWIWEGKNRLPKPMGKQNFFRNLAQKHSRVKGQRG